MAAETHNQKVDANQHHAAEALVAQSKVLEYIFSQFISELEEGRTLYEVGVKTEVMQALENAMKDPLQNLLTVNSRFDSRIKQLLDIYVTRYFRTHNDFIHSIYRSNTSDNTLYYGVVLNEDTFDNRDRLMDFFMEFPFSSLENRYPIVFQVMPLDSAMHLRNPEELKIRD